MFFSLNWREALASEYALVAKVDGENTAKTEILFILHFFLGVDKVYTTQQPGSFTGECIFWNDILESRSIVDWRLFDLRAARPARQRCHDKTYSKHTLLILHSHY